MFYKNVWRKLSLKELEKEDIVNTYIKIGTKCYEAIINEKFKKRNKYYPKIVKLYKYLEKNIDIAKEIYPQLLEHENITVKSIVCSHCLALEIYTKEAENILQEISKDEKNKVSAFEAEWTLKVWKEGNLTIYRKK